MRREYPKGVPGASMNESALPFGLPDIVRFSDGWLRAQAAGKESVPREGA